MNNFTVRLGGGNFSNSGSSLFLRKPDGTETQLGHSLEGFARARGDMDPTALDVVLFALAVYGCDRACSRDTEDDRWTRQYRLEMPVSDPKKWNKAAGIAERMVGFLTGDEWSFDFVPRDRDIFGPEFRREKAGFRKRTRLGGDAVSLFSGGLDSLIGVIDWLESHRNSRLTLSGAYDKHAEPANADQNRLFATLRAEYPNRLYRVTSRMGLLNGGEERSYRSRSFCFVAFGILAASFLQAPGELLIPENGSIGLNYPLTAARSGSLSTRTVHPYFLAQLRELLAALDLETGIRNPYELKTKGEMILECGNPGVLQKCFAGSVSCGNRKQFRVQKPGATEEHCGWCVPCLFRRAALHHAGLASDDFAVLIEDPRTWGSVRLDDPNSSPEATREFVLRNESDQAIWRTITANGRVPLGQKNDFVDLVKRQRAELRSWFVAIGKIGR